jgi:hypothetical protein
VARRSCAAFGSAALALVLVLVLVLALALVLVPVAAEAAVSTDLATGPARSRAHPAGSAAAQPRPTDLAVSRFGDRGDHDLYCPHALEPSPLVVIAPDQAQSREALGTLAEHLARAGFVVAVVDPPAGVGQGAKLSGVIDALTAAKPLERREAGCRLAPGVAAWGIGSGAAVILEVAAVRATARRPLAAVVVAFGTAQAPAAAQATPTLAIAGEDSAATAPAPPPRWQLVVEDANACDLDSSYCRGTPIERRRGEHHVQISSDASDAIERAVISWLRAQVEGDPVELAGMASWKRRIPLPPRRYHVPAHRERLTQFSAPLVLGRTVEDSDFVWGIRPEVVRTWATDRGRGSLRDWTSHSIGGYIELLRVGGDSTLGGGLTYVHTRQPFAAAPSLGLYRTWADPSARNGIAASLYVGLRSVDVGPAALPFGGRIEVRRDLGSSPDRSILLSFEADIISALIVFLGATSGGVP